jgi:peptidoglycan-associated lipoprotein
MHSGTKFSLLLAASLLVPAALKAQVPYPAKDHHEVDLAVTYTEQYSNLVSTPTFWHGGGGIELSTQTYRGLGVTANIAGTQTDNAAGSGIGLTLITATFGPRYTYYKPFGSEHKRSLAIFGQALGGQAWGFNSFFPTASGGETDHMSVAMALGGGVDIGLSRHLGVRAFQADWVRTQFPNGTTDVQNTLRLGAGVVFRFSRGK